MGSCISCQSKKRKRNHQNNDKNNKENVFKDSIVKCEDYDQYLVQETFIESINNFNSEYCGFEDFGSYKFDASDLLTDSVYSDDEEKSIEYAEDNGIMVSKTLSHTSEQGNQESKRKKSAFLTSKYEINPTDCENICISDSYSIEDPKFHKMPERPSFLENPLTLEDIEEMLSNNEKDENDPTISSLSFQSSVLSSPSNPDRVDYTLLSNNNTEYKEKKVRSFSDHLKPDDTFIFKSTHVTNTCTVLNAVPNMYNDFINIQKKSGLISPKCRAFSDPPRPIGTEIFSILYKINENNQNVIHKMVLKQDLTGAATLLNCLKESSLLKKLLNGLDIYQNTPLSYSIEKGDLKMTQLLLSYDSKIHQKVFLINQNISIPTIFLAYRHHPNSMSFSISENSIFTLICSHASLMNDKTILSNLLEEKNSDDLTILQYAILNFIPINKGSKPLQIVNYNAFFSYLLQIGASLSTKCKCALRKEITVDALGQVLHSKYPIELFENFQKALKQNMMNIQWTYIMDGLMYSVEEIFALRTDITNYQKIIMRDKLYLLQKDIKE